MIKEQRSFINELGNQIEMKAHGDAQSITIFAFGPTSQVEHTWTLLEAKKLQHLLNDVIKEIEYSAVLDYIPEM